MEKRINYPVGSDAWIAEQARAWNTRCEYDEIVESTIQAPVPALVDPIERARFFADQMYSWHFARFGVDEK